MVQPTVIESEVRIPFAGRLSVGTALAIALAWPAAVACLEGLQAASLDGRFLVSSVAGVGVLLLRWKMGRMAPRSGRLVMLAFRDQEVMAPVARVRRVS